ncbi:hypothetical protein C0J45_21479 [Silurus meridionalis]|nr:hypothetical protein C0J45_21479 [Silurus meridionalis]
MRSLAYWLCVLSVLHALNAQFDPLVRRALFALVAPAVLRVETNENILLEAFGLSQPVSVSVSVYDFPAKSHQFWQGSVTLNSDNNYNVLQSIKSIFSKSNTPRLRQQIELSAQINPSFLQQEEKETKYVELVAQFGDFQETDKPIYNPGDTVHSRAFVSNAAFQAFNGTISVEIQNPDGITVYTTGRSKAENGVFPNTYALSDIVKEGKWKIIAKFNHWEENTFSADFEVKKYVLPAFNVTLIPQNTHFSMDGQELKVEVHARYVYGEKVKGVAYVVFGVEKNGEKVRLPSMKQVNNLDGGTATLTIDELRKAYSNINSLVGSSIYIKASVLTSSGSDLVEAEKSGIKIVLAPYVLAIKDTSKFYKSGLPFDMTVTVSHHDGSPAPNVPVKINLVPTLFTLHSGTIKASLNMPSDIKLITAETLVQGLRQEQQTKAKWIVQPYTPFNPEKPNQLHVMLDKYTGQAGQTLNFQLHLSTFSEKEKNFLQHVSYIVLNKGRIIRTGKIDIKGHEMTNFPLLLTSEMMPAFRFVVYYILPWSSKIEVVSDSILVAVESNCVGSLKVEPLAGEVMSSYSPGDSLSFQVRGDPGAKVSLVAVDNSVFLLSKGRLTQKKFLQRCCSDGMRDIPMAYSCRRRALYIGEEWSCVIAFLMCCSKYRGEELGVVTPPPPTTPEPSTTPEPTISESISTFYFRPVIRQYHRAILPLQYAAVVMAAKVEIEDNEDFEQVDEDNMLDDSDYEIDDIYVRKKFSESWLWTDVKLPGTPGTDGLAVMPVKDVLPDSITQWGILGVSASSKTGFCVAEPFNIRAFKRFFIDLRLPRTAARNEHVEVKAVLHNYMNENLTALVILSKTVDMCSVAFTGDHKQEVFVRAQSSVLIPYTVIPLQAGALPLQVTAVSRSLSGQDAIRKILHVVVEGIQKMNVRSYVLNPATKGDIDGNQAIRVDKVKLSSVVPNSLPETFVNVRGHLIADSIDNSINQDSLAALIRMPGGCVEQNLASITLPLIAVHYLDRSSQWESVGMQRRDEALKYIKKGYENQLHYRKTDYSYPPYRNEGTSTWITAFVVKVFSMAYPFITVDNQNICSPLLYLLKHKQLHSGAFKEDNPVYTTSMTGGLRGVMFQRAGDYLKERYHRLRRPYSVAIACYALAVSNQGCAKSVLLKSASADRTHWPDADNSLFALEATGYALLALLEGGHFEEAAAPFNWLNQHRRVGGGYGSTQSTMVVLQALSKYLVKKPSPADMNLHVDLSVPGRSDVRWAFNSKLAHVARSARVRVLSVSMSQYDRYEMQILQVIKEGSEVGLKEKDTRVFLSHAGCRAGLNLLKDQDYLIIGPPSDIWQAGSDENRYTYTLGKGTWVEHWPSPADCNAQAQDKCKQLEQYASELGDTGCRT